MPGYHPESTGNDARSPRGSRMTKAREIMTAGVEFTSVDETIEDAARKLAQNDIGVLPICGDDRRLQGMLTDRDIVVKVVAAGKDPKSTTVSILFPAPRTRPRTAQVIDVAEVSGNGAEVRIRAAE